MSNTQSKFSNSNRTGMPVFGTYNNSQASILLEKSNPGLRRSTPDSEALASSDEELEPSRLRNINRHSMAQPARRTFSLADHPSIHRKPSMTASGTYSPSNSNPATPAADQNPWPAMSPSGTTWGSSSGYPWNGGIWAHESKREPPARLQEVHHGENEAGIPFSIPLQPTIKTYRSQSYSVGQNDQPISIHPNHPAGTPVSAEAGRTRTTGQYPPLQRRTSRPGMMSAGDVGGLGRLREVDDDEETLDVTQRNVDQAREIERLEEENARLRAAQRERKMSSNSAIHAQPAFRNTQIRGAVLEESDLAVDDSEGPAQFRNGISRRFSEQLGQHPDGQSSSPVGHRLSRWNTAGNYGRLADIPQSRRHSFAADVPTRQGSFSSHGKVNQQYCFGVLSSVDEAEANLYGHATHGIPNLDDPVYFKLDEKRRLEAEASVQQGLYSDPYGLSAGINPYGSTQSFIIVNFKCCRSDIFYIQEGTGLHVQIGDLVVVDADRGTDLGAVQHTGVSLEGARRYKDYYAEEHYKLLMMFSQQTKNGGMNAVNPNGPPSRQSAVGGMGPQGHGHRDPHADPKAKMVKRLAQTHEIQALKEKEGNEAKAKRVCSAKVVEHSLNMEILDAEFQMDQKKLTFYYFADEYINFNALVTDLFKIYKTRIWMSAINPASFQTPTSSLGLTPAYGNTGMTSPLSPMNEPSRRGQYGGGNNGMIGQYEDQRMEMRPRGAAPPFYPSYQSQTVSGQRLGGMNGFPPPAMDPFAPYPQQNFGMFGQPAPGFGMHHQEPRQGVHNQSPGPNFIGRFQGLSMGS